MPRRIPSNNWPRIEYFGFELDTDEETRIVKEKIRYALENIPYQQKGVVQVYKDDFFDIIADFDAGSLCYKTPEDTEYNFACNFGASYVENGKLNLGHATCAVISVSQERAEYFARMFFEAKRAKQIAEDNETQAFKKQIKDIFSNIKTTDPVGKVLLDNDYFKIVLKENEIRGGSKRGVDIEWFNKKTGKDSVLYYKGIDVDGKIVLEDDGEQQQEEVAAEVFGWCYYVAKEREKALQNPQVKDAMNKITEALKKIDKNFKSGDTIYEDQFCKITLEDQDGGVLNANLQKKIKFFNKITKQYYHRDEYYDFYDILYFTEDEGWLHTRMDVRFDRQIGLFHYLSQQREKKQQKGNGKNNENNNNNQNNDTDNLTLSNFIAPNLPIHTKPDDNNNNNLSNNNDSNSLNNNNNNNLSKNNNDKQTIIVVNNSESQNNNNKTNSDQNKNTQTNKEEKSYIPSFVSGGIGVASGFTAIFVKGNKIALITCISIGSVGIIFCAVYTFYAYDKNKKVNNNNFSKNNLNNRAQEPEKL